MASPPPTTPTATTYRSPKLRRRKKKKTKKKTFPILAFGIHDTDTTILPRVGTITAAAMTDSLRSYQRNVARPIATSFRFTEPFNPQPALVRNNHIQTIAGFGLRQQRHADRLLPRTTKNKTTKTTDTSMTTTNWIQSVLRQ
jgi:hypothetical protein